MIDLSFLTEEEQETIRAVLKRDAELKKTEEQRVRNLQKTVRDKGRLRYMTGEWFYETKQLRHQDRIHGSEIIRASMKHSHKPLTILELSQLIPEKPRSVSSENKDFVPPALCGFLQEQHSDERYENIKACEILEHTPTPILHSLTKQRQNPFNSDIIESHSFENKDSSLMDGAVDLTQTQHEEPLPSFDSCFSYTTNLKQYPSDRPITQNASILMPMSEKRTVPSSRDCFVEEEGPGGQQTSSAVQQGILKHLSAFSSTDSLLSCLDLQSAIGLNSPTDKWIDSKQVRFSSMVSQSGVEWQDRKQLGENSLLDIDSFTPSEVEIKCELEDTGKATVCTHRPLLNPSQVDLQEGDLNCKTQANTQEAGQQHIDISEHCISEFSSPAVSKLILVEQESGKLVQLETDHHSETTSTDWITGCNIHHPKLPEERANVTVEDPLAIKPSHYGLTGSSSTVSPKPRQRLLRIFRGEKEKTAEVHSRKKEEVKIAMQKEPGNTQNLCQGAAGYDESSSPILSAFKRLSSMDTSSSKSLENLSFQTTSTVSSSKQMKTDVSMTVLQQEENDSDSTFETDLGWRRNTGSSTSNFSLSSGMASMSSVSGSVCSLYPEDFGDIEVQGSIQFALNYIQKLQEFHIFVVHCRDLAVADNKKNCSDPYVKCYLLPDKTKLGKRKTTIKKKTLNPTYNEILRFKIILEVFKTQSLNISVWHSNTFGRNSFLGEVDLDMSEWDFNNTHINECALKSKVSGQNTRASPTHLMDSRGQMRVALRFLPQTPHGKRTSRMETGEVQIWVKDCKNLPPVRGIVTDPFVKCTILPDTSTKSRQKTRVVKRAANPMFNHTMVYNDVRLEHLKEACVEMTVWDHDRLNNHYIGGLRLGLGTGKSYGVEVVWMDSTTDEANLWQRMLHSDGEWVEDDLPLRMLVMVKK
uniref:synaptotagmin-like protein 2 isoform X3 n=1 Tax=Gasterosteus aculeatus aculeatus TaxID=481459 RepID=UPI001A9A119A|nr:synaptotagmin-like protein 2 isoform X3 [Gasterosteus aculeatus aculeatus]